MSCPLLNPSNWSESDKVGTKKYLNMLATLKIVGQYVSPAMSKNLKMSMVAPMGIDTNRVIISHPVWWGFCQTLSDADGAFGTEAGQELLLLFSLKVPLSFLPCCACKCSSCRADLLHGTQDGFQHRTQYLLACFSSQPLNWHRVGTPQNFPSSRPGQRHHSARKKLQHQCFTLSLNAGVQPLNTKLKQLKESSLNPKLLV